MSTFFSRPIRKRRRIASPGHLLEWAVMLTALFILAQLFGLRQFTSVLNGTIGSTDLNWQTASFLGAAYVFIYLGFVLGVPILILAAGLLKLWQRLADPEMKANESAANPQKN